MLTTLALALTTATAHAPFRVGWAQHHSKTLAGCLSTAVTSDAGWGGLDAGLMALNGFENMGAGFGNGMAVSHAHHPGLLGPGPMPPGMHPLA